MFRILPQGLADPSRGDRRGYPAAGRIRSRRRRCRSAGEPVPGAADGGRHPQVGHGLRAPLHRRPDQPSQPADLPVQGGAGGMPGKLRSATARRGGSHPRNAKTNHAPGATGARGGTLTLRPNSRDKQNVGSIATRPVAGWTGTLPAKRRSFLVWSNHGRTVTTLRHLEPVRPIARTSSRLPAASGPSQAGIAPIPAGT